MPNLKTCEQHMAQETTANASLGEIPLLHKGEKQKPLHCQQELKTIGTKSKRLTSRLQRCDTKMAKETTSHASFRKYYSSIKARSKNFFTFKIKLVKTETTSSEFKAEITNMSPTNGTADNVSHFLR